jgi:hypothetical protein
MIAADLFRRISAFSMGSSRAGGMDSLVGIPSFGIMMGPPRIPQSFL